MDHQNDRALNDDDRLGGIALTSLALPLQLSTIIVIFAGNAAQALIYDALPPILVPLATQFGGGASGAFIAQLATTVPLLGVGLAGFIAGLIIERAGLRRVLLFSLIAFGSTGIAGAVIGNAELFIATRFLMGFAVGLMSPCCTTLVAHFFVGAPRARMNGGLVAGGAVFAIAFIFVSSVLATHYSWQAPFALHGVLALFFLPAALLLPQIHLQRRVADKYRDQRAALHRVRHVTPYYVIAFCLMTLTFMFNAKLAFVLASVGVASTTTVATVFAFNPAGAFIGSSAFGRWGSSLETKTVLQIAFFLDFVGLVLVGGASNSAMFCAGALAGGLGCGFGIAALWTIVMDRLPSDLEPRGLGLLSATINLGASLSPILASPLMLISDERHQYLLVAGLLLLVLLVSTATSAHATEHRA